MALALGVAAIAGSCGREPAGEILLWHFWERPLLAPLLREFEAAHPGVTVRDEQLTWDHGLEKITAAFAAGRPPDLLELGSTWAPRFAEQGALQPLPADVGDRWGERLALWGPVEATVADGARRRYGLPWLAGTRCLFYDRALFRKAGLDPDRPPATWEEMRAAAAAIHDPDHGIYGVGLNAGERYVLYKKFLPFAWGAGGGVLASDRAEARCVVGLPEEAAAGAGGASGAGGAGDPASAAPRWDSVENRRALAFLLSLRPHAITDEQKSLDRLFRQGRIGLLVTGGWNVKLAEEEAPDLDYGVALVPGPAHGVSASFAGGEMLCVPARAKNARGAWELAEWLVEGGRALRVARAAKSVFPADRAALSDEYYRSRPKEAVFLEQMATAIAPPFHPKWDEIQDVLDASLEEAFLGTSPPEKALADGQRRLEALLAPAARGGR